jgi:hypothetical protein
MRTSAAGCLAGLSLAAIAVAGCAADAGDTARFCGQVAANQETILALPTTADDIDDYVSTYRTIGESAPLAIEQEWDALVLNYETASTVDPGDPESLQRVVAQAVRTERSAIAVHDWLLANCDVDLGNVATIGANRPPPAPPPAGG